jgi:CRISPR-associated protein Cmr5
MKSKIDQLIPLACEAIHLHLCKTNTLEVEKEYVGYISSFATGIRQSGMIATVAMFANSTQGKDTKKLLDAIYHVLRKGRADATDATLFEYLLNHQNDALLRSEIENIAIALKLSLRTFNLVKPQKDGEK